MRKYALLIALFTFPMIGCMPPLNDGPPGGGADGGSTHTTGSGDMAGPGGQGADQGGTPGTGVSGTISTDTTWSGLTNVSGAVTVSSGVTLTISAGSLVTFASGAGVTVDGSLVVSGTAQSHVTLNPVQMGSSWAGLMVQSGGSLDLSYADIDSASVAFTCVSGATKCAADHAKIAHGGGAAMLTTSATFSYLDVENTTSDGISAYAPSSGPTDFTVTITDSTFHLTGGDSTHVTGGNLTFQYNNVYGDTTASHGQHCAGHFEGAGVYLIDHNNFNSSVYGLMAYGLTNALDKINSNNFKGDTYPADPSGTISPQADLKDNYWGTSTCPTSIDGNTTANTCATAELTGTGPR